MNTSRDSSMTQNNSTVNRVSNGSEQSCKEGTIDCHPNEMVAAYVILWIEFAACIFFNVLVIVLLMRVRRKSRMNFFVLHLAISDIFVGLFYMIPLSFIYGKITWTIGDLPCQITMYLGNIGLYSSSAMLVVLSFDRLYVIAMPIKSVDFTRCYRYTMVGTAWMIGILLALPAPFGSAADSVTGIPICATNYKNDEYKIEHKIIKFLETVSWVGVFIVPAIVIIICHISILFLLWKRHHRGLMAKQAVTSIHKDGSHQNTCDTRVCMRSQHRSETRGLEITILVVSAFIICWSPSCINSMFNTYGVITGDGGGGYYYILYATAPLNSAVNPIIFLIFSRCLRYRKQGSSGNASCLPLKNTSVRSNLPGSRSSEVRIG